MTAAYGFIVNMITAFFLIQGFHNACYSLRKHPHIRPLVSLFTVPSLLAIDISVFFVGGDMFYELLLTTFIALHLWVIWQWWKGRRRKRPSRAAGIVYDLGHRLVVQPVQE
jgi:hypothetical protein